jgi:hypothetical protein
MSTPTVPLPLLTLGMALGVATACCSTPSPSASKESPTTAAATQETAIIRDTAALGAWSTDATESGIHAFVWDGQSVTLFLFTEKEWMWRSRDDHYRVNARWAGDTLEYQPPFGRWQTLATWKGATFDGYLPLDPSGPLTDSQTSLLSPRALHDYEIKPTDEPGWRKPSPPHHAWWPGLSVRDGDKLLDAPEADVALARAYPRWLDKGAVTDEMRVSISTARTVVHVGESVRVVHVAEVLRQEEGSVYVMGPKPAFQEYVDGTLRTALPVVPEYPWLGIYDGRVLDGPNLDYNWDVTEYRFDTPGVHKIQWRPRGHHASNTLTIVVVP